MTIKDQIEQLIRSYKDNFYEATGIQLYAYPATKMHRKPLAILIKLAEEQCGIDSILTKCRERKYLNARKMVCKAAYEMEYPVGVIASALKMDRTSVIHHNRVDDLDPVEYAKYTQKILAPKI